MITTADILDPLASGELQFPSSVRERLAQRASHLKMLPAVATQTLDIAKNPDCGIEEFAAVVERDSALAADILKMANGLVFGASRAVMNLHQAVVRLGFRQCKSLILAASFSSMMKTMSLEEEWVRELLFRHSFTTALLATHLNRALNVGFQGEEFAGGLMHDIGRMLLATCYPERFSEIDPMSFDESLEMLCAEQTVIETNHCEVGVWFARRNSLPEPLVDVIRFHHCPDRAVNNRRFVALIAVCDQMANYLQQREKGSGYNSRGNSSIELLEDCGVAHASRRFHEIAVTVMETASRDITEMLAL